MAVPLLLPSAAPWRCGGQTTTGAQYRCGLCGEWKPAAAFHAGNLAAHVYRCKTCVSTDALQRRRHLRLAPAYRNLEQLRKAERRLGEHAGDMLTRWRAADVEYLMRVAFSDRSAFSGAHSDVRLYHADGGRPFAFDNCIALSKYEARQLRAGLLPLSAELMQRVQQAVAGAIARR
jgi:hypothetical protein